MSAVIIHPKLTLGENDVAEAFMKRFEMNLRIIPMLGTSKLQCTYIQLKYNLMKL